MSLRASISPIAHEDAGCSRPETLRRLLTNVVLVTSVLAIATSACRRLSETSTAAIEVKLAFPQDRIALLDILRQSSSSHGLDAIEGSGAWREMMTHSPDAHPNAILQKTIYVALWRGHKDDDLEALVDDGGHMGRPWVIFYDGQHVDLSRRFRTDLISSLRKRWPSAIYIPVDRGGGLPSLKQVEGDGVQPSKAAVS